VIAAVAVLTGINEIFVLFGAGLAGVVLYFIKGNKVVGGFFPFTVLQIVNPINPATSADNLKLFWIFLKIGSILYGSGYVLFAFLDAELVSKGLLTKQQLIDAVAVGQFTPGPVFSAATFIGWQIGGAVGAIAATVGIFLPSFLFVAFLNPLIPKLRRSKVMSAFLDTVNIASIAIILSVLIEMGKATLVDWKTILIAVVSFAITFFYKKLNTAFIVVGGALLGYLLTLI
ncbi:MAG: chromate transporter, partial [Bacteroidota bacterium]|nr:chromate transporter [Bacteroidota bacterium]